MSEIPDDHRSAWTEADRELAATLWGKLTEPAKALFSILIDHPGQKFTGDELAHELGLANGRQSTKSVLSRPGALCTEFGRIPLWSWDYPDGKRARYWTTPEVAGIFRQARGN
ncbi:hypothetical protein SAMN05216553_102292 [Lentzea fradiae]|uniref:Uncharacterized protein n=1 Tax=Lentzea fradiae TaxID=200378 RepID=A0A1G7MGG7_9PSEU|nr:DUF6416 domain-containing protein [Lentzea fradiae]SDF60795.1 hypothetical protein SAMN05216553_102292 [Lentzea fradiae]